ncbi:alpha/beta hydrolase [Thioalkalivibrio sp. XN8]|uniref:lipase family alpha/beta hydrolase n=1 Tax=Thioalkalivibrio sp. XN8 TaxID=2712863 RepID=UPI0013EE3476|nr:alpha/beta hydrolase [Thioalkalivibrio sp. XN8]NGP53287.1 alpha/beta hydrolase [Thioalkalivibrio sp. XN8]
MTLCAVALAADLRGASRLLVDAATGVTDLVESMHGTIAGLAGIVPGSSNQRTRGITRFVYRCVGGGIRLVGAGIERTLVPVSAWHQAGHGAQQRPARHAAALGVLNGVLGDHLAATGNPLAISMGLRRDGMRLELGRAALRRAVPAASPRILVQAHGLCMHPGHWERAGRDEVAAAGARLGYTCLQLHYNTGLHIAANGRSLAALLENLLAQWPVEVRELAIVGHSMGGLVARSAHHYGAAAGHAWPERLRKLVFLGAPHHGSPLERAGNGLDMLLGLSPYSRPFTRLGRVRSHGITDLRFGILLEQDWAARDRYAPMRKDPRTPLPLPERVECYTAAALRGENEGALSARLVGDGLVPLASALGEHEDARFALDFPPGHRWVGTGLSHFDLVSSPRLLAQLARWLGN